jgi:ATP-dependent protease ClpP protease subunit
MSRRSRSRAQQKRLQNLRYGAQVKQGEQPKTWYQVKNFVDQPDVAAIYLYGEIGYWGVEAQDFVRDLMSLRVSTIVVHINSPGGEVFDGLAIFHALRDHPATIEVRVDGLAASAASFIAMAGDTVVMQRNAQMMIHDASGIEIGNAQDMRTMADLLDMCSDNIADIYVQQAGGTVELWRTAMQAETWYTAAEALAAGLCDEVAGADDETNEDTAVVPGEDDDADGLMDTAWDLSVFAFKYGGREKAPTPTLPVDAADAAVDGTAPVVEPAAATEAPVVDDAEPVTEEVAAAAVEPGTEPVEAAAEPDAPVVATEPDQEPEPALELGDEPEPPAPASEALVLGDDVPDSWAALTGGLLTNAAPSTVDDLFAALKEGLPA